MSHTPDCGTGGRAASFAHRRALSAGKAALPPSTDRVAPRIRPRAAASVASSAVVPAPASQPPSTPIVPVNGVAHAAPAVTTIAGSARDVARLRRAQQSRSGRGDAPPAPPVRTARSAAYDVAVATPLPAAVPRTAAPVRNGVASHVTGTRHIIVESGPTYATLAKKVGHARTLRGLVVSGTLVRSSVRVTGDEAGAGITITGEADQHVADDLTERGGAGAGVPAQYRRRNAPHGASALGRATGTAGTPGSRERSVGRTIEATAGGLPVTGSAIGRSLRVTGDEAGTCRRLTGDQYLAPPESRAECGGPAGAERRVAAAAAPRERITGDSSGLRRGIADGPRTYPERVPAAPIAVTGNTPRHAAGVTGTGNGSARTITGSAYYVPDVEANAPHDEPVERIDAGFSVVSPQRSAHLRARTDGTGAARGITGSFAIAQDKITGNREFQFRSRNAAESAERPARERLTGEGNSANGRITGDAWAAHPIVGGTEASFAADRNASQRAGKPQAFAGARRFKTLARSEEPKKLVTGMFGSGSDTGAKVTLSGGAQG
jgi:hypothetical protein